MDDLNVIRIFLAAADAGSFAQIADLEGTIDDLASRRDEPQGEVMALSGDKTAHTHPGIQVKHQLLDRNRNIRADDSPRIGAASPGRGSGEYEEKREPR